MKRTSYQLNVVPIQVPKHARLRVGYLPYTSEALEELRSEHRGTHYFKWDRKRDQIACVALTDLDPMGEQIEELACCTNPWLVAPLVLESLLRFFHLNRRPVLGHKPLRIVTKQRGDDLLRRVSVEGVTLPDWLARRISYVFDTRTVYPDHRTPEIGLACDVRVTNIINAPASELLTHGISLEGMYVQRRTEGRDSRLWPKSKLLGRVSEVIGTGEDALLRFDDHAEESPEAWARDVYLEPRQENVDRCVRAVAGPAAPQFLNRAAAAAESLRRGDQQCRLTDQMFGTLRTRDLELVPGVGFEIGPVLREGEGKTWYPPTRRLERPGLVFSPNRSRLQVWNQGGLDDNGPYDAPYFAPKIPEVAVICQARHEGTVDQWMARFLDGMPDAKDRHGRVPFKAGFIRRFRLQNARTHVFKASGSTAAHYEAACRQALSVAAERNQPWTLAIVQTEEAFFGLPDPANPYLTTRSMLLKRGVPVQGIQVEKMMKSPLDLGFIMNDVSLAIYAKLGGVPWLLNAQSTVARELVIGLGSHVVRQSRFSHAERLVGISTFFTTDGLYLGDTRTRAVPYTEYANAVLESVSSAVQAIRREQQWRISDSLRLVFHAFKPFRDEEVHTLQRLVGQLGHTDVQIAFLHLAEDHAYRLFDTLQEGVPAAGREKKGVWAPERGQLVQLNDSEALVTFVGAREVKKPGDGTPQPILLRLHPLSTYRDIIAMARQAYDFSCHSWRTFHPARLPVTMLYSDLIARQMAKLANVPGWDNEAIELGPIQHRPWFL